MEKIEITDAKKQLIVNNACMDGSAFTNICGKELLWDDVNLTGTKIKNANLSDLEIEGAQLGGAYIHNIGLPPKGHPHHHPDARQRPLRFEDCDLNNSAITNCNLSGVSIEDCNLAGMKINGIDVAELLEAFESFKKK